MTLLYDEQAWTAPPPADAVAQWVARDEAVMSPSLTRPYPFVMARGRGAWVWDEADAAYLDFTAGIAVLNTGHCHPHVVAAVQRQAEQFLHMAGTDFYYPVEITLAERLAALAPTRGRARVFFGNSGTEMIEGAIKLARYATGRPNLLAFTGAFHGRTLGALSLTASKAVQRDRFGPFLPGVFHAPYPRADRDDTVASLAAIERLLTTTLPADSLAAIVVEPVQGEGGYLVPPADFLPALRALCDRIGALLVVDEVQSGMGRTGRMFAVEHTSTEPDILCLAKGIASGLPLGALIAGDHLMTWPPGAHGNTFGGNPVACAAAHATLDLLEGGLVANAAAMGARLMAALRAGQGTGTRMDADGEGWTRMGEGEGDDAGAPPRAPADFRVRPGSRTGRPTLMDEAHEASMAPAPLPLAGEGGERSEPGEGTPLLTHALTVRGLGLMIGVDVGDHDRQTAVVEAAFRRRLLTLPAGASTVRLSPPLTLTAAEVDDGAARLLDAIAAVDRGEP